VPNNDDKMAKMSGKMGTHETASLQQLSTSSTIALVLTLPVM